MSNQTRKPVLITSTTNSSNGCGSKICIKYRKYLKRVLHGGVVRVSDWFSKGWVFEPELRRSIHEMIMSNQTRKPVLMTSTTNSSNGCGSKICIKYRKYLKRVLHGGVVRVSDWFSKGWVFEPELRRSIHEMIMSNQTRKPVLMTSTTNSSNGCGSKICSKYRKY